MKRDLTQAERTAISRRQIQRLEAEADARRKAADQVALDRQKAALLRIKERQEKSAQRRPELVQLERKKAAQRRSILGR
jgi:hypothetical protein